MPLPHKLDIIYHRSLLYRFCSIVSHPVRSGASTQKHTLAISPNCFRFFPFVFAFGRLEMLFGKVVFERKSGLIIIMRLYL
jgi:hypothetical protein